MVAVSQRKLLRTVDHRPDSPTEEQLFGMGVRTAHFVGVIGAVSPDREQVVTGA